LAAVMLASLKLCFKVMRSNQLDFGIEYD